MAGWRVGMVVGNRQVIGALFKFKAFIDYGIPSFIQRAAIEALTGSQASVGELCRSYQARRDILVAQLRRVGWSVPASKASMYLWARLPEKVRYRGSLGFCEDLLLKTGVVLAPGVGFGPFGEGYVRFALVAPQARLVEAARRIGEYLEGRAQVSGAGARKRIPQKALRTTLVQNAP